MRAKGRWARIVAHFAMVLATTVLAHAETAAPNPRSARALETTLLPLLIDTVAVPQALGVRAGYGGGITIVDDIVVIVDLRGAFFKAEAKGERFSRLDLPPIPDNAQQYDQFAPKPSMLGPFGINFGFVVHDVESRKEARGIRLLVSYERYLPELRTTQLAVSTLLLSADDHRPLGGWDDLYQSQPLKALWYSGVAGGGRMFVRGDDLYLTVGDYNQDNVSMPSRLEAQNPDSDFGKILRIDLRTKAKSIVSIGHRNPQGLLMTAAGTLYSTEHGPRGGDTLNLITAGSNFGWPVTTLGTHYTTYDWPNRKQRTAEQKFNQPLFAWLPSIGVSNLIEVVNFNSAWDGDLLVESLVGQTLHRLRRDIDGHVIYSEAIVLGQRLRDIGALQDGTLVLWTDAAQLMFVSVDRARLAANRRLP